MTMDRNLLIHAMEGAYEQSKEKYQNGYYIWELLFEMAKFRWSFGLTYDEMLSDVLEFLENGHARGERYCMEFVELSLGTVYPSIKKIYFVKAEGL